MGRTIALMAALAGALLLAWTGTKSPAPEPASATPVATAFQTDLAMVDIRRIARTPHPAGSAENVAVRDYLIGRMSALGLQPTVEAGLGVETSNGWVLGGQVENVIGILPGKDRAAPAVALMAHYDSVPASPGAADDATGVAVALDLVRALKAQGTPERDVIILLTDGEEAGLLGARLFFAEHPLRKRIGVLINLESRGGGGRANMFQTGAGNGALIPVFARTAYQPISNSLAVFLYERMPNNTDFTVSKDLGIRGLNYAFIGRQFDYHSPTSTPVNLDQGSVRHMGRQALAATSALAFAETLPGKAPDAVYSQTFGDHLLAYPAWRGWIALLLAAGLIGLAIWRGRTDEDFRRIDAARGAGAAVFLLLAGALVLHLARRATGVEFGFLSQRPLLAQWTLWETMLTALGLGLLLGVPGLLAAGGTRMWLVGSGLFAGLLCLAFGGWDPLGVGFGVATAIVGYAAFGKTAGLSGSWLGVLLTGLVVAVALQIALPAIAFLVTWPLVLAALAATITQMGTRLDLPRTLALTLLATLGGGWVAVFFHVVSQGLDLPEMLTLYLWLAAFLVWPLAWPGRFPKLAVAPAAAFLLAGLVLLGAVRLSDPWSARHPQATIVLLVREALTGRTQLVAATPDLSAWSRQVLTAEGGTVSRTSMPPIGRGKVWVADARAGAPTAAPVTAVRLPDGRLEITLPPSRVTLLEITVVGPMPSVAIDGKPVPPEPVVPLSATPPAESQFQVRLAGQPVAHRITVMATGAVDVRYGVVTPGWPADATPLPPRPSDVMPFDLSDSMVTTGLIHLD